MHGLRWLLASNCIVAGFSVSHAQGVLDSIPPGSTSVHSDSIVIATGSDTAQTPASCNACDSMCQSRFDSLWNQPTLTGDWLGLRPRLEESGIKFEGNITQFAFGMGGGVNQPVPPPLGQGNLFAYTGRGDYALTFDLEKFGGLPKGTLLVRAQNWWGEFGNVSFNSGAIMPMPVFAAATPVVPNDPGVPFITDFLLTQPLSKNWVVFAGKRGVVGAIDQDDFAGGNGTNQFMNLGFVGNPSLILSMPYSAFTAGVVSPRDWGSVTTFIIDAKDRTKNFFALDSLFSEGFLLGGEIKVRTKFFDLPGEQHVGGLYKHVELTNLNFAEPPPGEYPYPTVPGFPTLPDSYTIYYGFDQYVQVYSEDTKRGWGLFGRASISDANPTPFRYFVSAGIGGFSPFRSMRGDKFGIGVYYTGISNEFGPLPRAVFGPRPGWGTELYYSFQINPWMDFTPDFQILKPEAGRIAETAYLGGIRLNIKF